MGTLPVLGHAVVVGWYWACSPGRVVASNFLLPNSPQAPTRNFHTRGLFYPNSTFDSPFGVHWPKHTLFPLTIGNEKVPVQGDMIFLGHLRQGTVHVRQPLRQSSKKGHSVLRIELLQSRMHAGFGVNRQTSCMYHKCKRTFPS